MAYTVGVNKTKDTGSSLTSFQISHPTNINELLWENTDRTLRELIYNFRLPLTVKLKTGDISKYCLDKVYVSNTINETKHTESPTRQTSTLFSAGERSVKAVSSFDSTTSSSSGGSETKTYSCTSESSDIILQIHETRRRKIILARKMTWEKHQNDYVVSGEQLEIPVSLQGWLEVVPDDGRPVEYFDTISGIASIKPNRFLVRTSIVGYQLSTEANGNTCWMPCELKPGEILTTGIVYVDNRKIKHAAPRNILKRLLMQNKTKKEQDLTYLQCFDIHSCEIMIPFIMSGVFSPVGEPTLANYDAVYEIQDLIMAFGLPVNAQLIHGKGNDGFICPRGVIRLYGTREEELAIVSKVQNGGVLDCESSSNETFQIPIDKMLFNRGIAKKKPVIKSKLTEGPYNPYKKGTHKSRPEQYDIKNKDYVLAKSVENVSRPLTTLDQGLSSLINDKNNYVSANYMSKVAPKFKENRDGNCYNVIQDISVTENTRITSPSKYVPESKTQTLLSNADTSEGVSNIHVSEENTKIDIELPKRAPKEPKKSRSTSILDKLSVRRVKKERAKLKELRSDDVFSKRISRNELSYQEFFNGIENDAEDRNKNHKEKSPEDDSDRCGNVEVDQTCSLNSMRSVYSTSSPNILCKTSSKASNDETKYMHRSECIQKRDLPPIPSDSQALACVEANGSNPSTSNESLYEHLPPTLHSSHFRRASDSAILDNQCDDNVINDKDNDEDGYMVPLQVQAEQRYIKRSDVQILNNSQEVAHDSANSARLGKTKRALPREFVQKSQGYDDNQHIMDTSNLFNLAYTSTKFGENHPICTSVGPHAVSTSQLNGTLNVPSMNSKLTRSLSTFDQRQRDNTNTRDSFQISRQNSRLSQNAFSDPNTTLRSHSFRDMIASANAVLNYAESFHGIREGRSLPAFNDFQNNHTQKSYNHHSMYIHNSRPKLFSSRSTNTDMLSQQLQHDNQHLNMYGGNYQMHYSESEPNFQQKRAISLGGISDALLKQGDDSAISLGSKGDAGFQNESDYGYKEYMKYTDSEWIPPEQVDELTVQEVSKSLRYIGMKDRVVLRFYKEQIDGSMLCTLDKKLLKEGFPELNALEIKKILDFVQGWRPKKS